MIWLKITKNNIVRLTTYYHDKLNGFMFRQLLADVKLLLIVSAKLRVRWKAMLNIKTFC